MRTAFRIAALGGLSMILKILFILLDFLNFSNRAEFDTLLLILSLILMVLGNASLSSLSFVLLLFVKISCFVPVTLMLVILYISTIFIPRGVHVLRRVAAPGFPSLIPSFAANLLC